MKNDDPSTTDNAALRQQARQLYFQAYRIADIAEKLGVSEFTLYSWRRRERWDSTPDAERVQACASARLAQLIDKPEKNGRDFKEIYLIERQIARIQEKNNNSETKTRGRQKPPKTTLPRRRQTPCARISSGRCMRISAAGTNNGHNATAVF